MTGTTGDKLRDLRTPETDPRTAALLVEAGRLADRLDDLDGAIRGTNVLDLPAGLLAEARQCASTLKVILAELGVPKVEAIVEKQRSTVDELRARRQTRDAEREAEAPSSASS